LRESNISVVAQVAALCLNGAALLFGIAAIYSIAFPGPGGEWVRVGVFAAYAVNVPIGLAGLSIVLFVKRGAAWLRAACVALSLIVISLPVVANLIFWWHTQRS